MGTAKRQLEKLMDAHGKNYLCPECATYSLKIESFDTAYCEEGCQITDKETIQRLLDSNDFEISEDDDFLNDDDDY